MKKLFTFSLVLFAAVAFCRAQSVVNIDLQQNPVFEVSTNDVHLAVESTENGITLGGDLVVKGGSGSYDYRWYNAGGELGTTPTITITIPGEYMLDIKDKCDCQQTVRFFVSTAGVDLITVDTPSITPNPTSGYIEIKGFEAVQLAVVGMSGRLEVVIQSDGTALRSADLSSLAPGHYILTLTDAKGHTTVTRLIKK